MIRLLSILLLASSLNCAASAASSTSLDSSRPDVREFIETTVRDFAIDRQELEKLLARVQIRQSILDAISKPAERVVPWYEYREQFVTDERIRQGTDFWAAHRKQLAMIREDGIAAAVTGIVGVETLYGRQTGRYRVLDALATLAFDYPPRSSFFRSELQQFLLLTHEEKIDPQTALGSYAGAMGVPQFIPSSYRNFAVDGNGDGRRNLWSNWADVIGSVANYLQAHGWRTGEPVVVNATIEAADLSRFDTAAIALNETVASLRDKGVAFVTELPPESPAMLIVLEGRQGPEYRVGFNNFFVITRYNRSTKYANAVHDLGQTVHQLMQDAQP